MSKRKKVVASAAALAMVVVLALTGTFAWQSISQTAKNEKAATINPGGRLHDDFNGVDKRVYVENFTDPATGTPIFARIRLDEYMEIGEGAILKATDADQTAYANRIVDVVNDRTADGKNDRDKVESWRTRLPGDKTEANNPFLKYWDWSFGGDTIYMPTFDKDKDSLDADINGTWTYTDAAGWKPYGDYVNWAENPVKEAPAYYDADTNDVANEHAKGTETGAGTGDWSEGENKWKTKTETHNTAATLDAKVITMADWKAIQDPDNKVGNFWVWDADGWAYWANPIKPGEATGMFLNGIQLKDEMSDSWYYGINVVAQFATEDDLGWKDATDAQGTGATGFYDTTNNSKAPSKDAEKLLRAIGAKPAPVVDTVTITAPITTVAQGGTLNNLTAKASRAGVEVQPADIKWSVTGGTDGTVDGASTTAINETTGELTVDQNEKAAVLTVTATYEDPSLGKVTDSVIIKVTQAVGP